MTQPIPPLNGPSNKTPLNHPPFLLSRVDLSMALEQSRSLASSPVGGDEGGRHLSVVDGGDDGMRAPRLPRWTRQEILVLIQGKRVAESRVRRGRTGGLAFGPGQVEPKWASVSSYCKRHGVNRGPVQCRKRWSNLAGDYKKIKEWENQIREETESFWVMRNDLRREKKLPGFFDREVYDILDGGGGGGGGSSSSTVLALALALAPSSVVKEVDEEEEEEEEAVFDSGRSAAAADDGLFSDFEQQQSGGGGGHQDDEVGGGSPTHPDHKLPPTTTTTTLPPAAPPIPPFSFSDQPFTQGGSSQGGRHEKPQASDPPPDTEETARLHHQGRKRKRFATDGGGDDEEANTQQQQQQHNKLIKVLEDNGRLLSSHLEAQNTNFRLDREQRKDHVNSLVEVLNKLADAFVRIADKL